jgi:hypothetical protein
MCRVFFVIRVLFYPGVVDISSVYCNIGKCVLFFPSHLNIDINSRVFLSGFYTTICGRACMVSLLALLDYHIYVHVGMFGSRSHNQSHQSKPSNLPAYPKNIPPECTAQVERCIADFSLSAHRIVQYILIQTCT